MSVQSLWKGADSEHTTVGDVLMRMRHGGMQIESPFARALGKTAYIQASDLEYLIHTGHFDVNDVIELDFTC